MSKSKLVAFRVFNKVPALKRHTVRQPVDGRDRICPGDGNLAVGQGRGELVPAETAE